MALHARSISLPSTSHPLNLSIEDQLNRLRSLEATSCSSPSMICQNLNGIQNLYECVNSLLELSSTQQAIYRESDSKLVGDVLDGSLGLLDMCCTIKDVFSQMKTCVQDLESSLRRKNCRESSLAKYFMSKKNISRTVSKCSANLKRMQKSNSALLEGDSNLKAVISTLKDIELVSLTAFEFLLSFLCPAAKSKSIAKSLVSKFIQSKQVFCESNNRSETIDAALVSLNKQKSQKGNEAIQLKNVQKDLQALESTIQEFEEELECVFRRLIKNRVSLLNILNH